MRKRNMYLSALALLVFSCSETKVMDCPPKFTIYKHINKAYPVYAKETELALKNSLKTVKGIEDTASATLKVKTTKLRTDLDNISSRIEMLVKSNLQSYYAGICDPKVREAFENFQNKLADLTLKISQVSTQLEGNRGGSKEQDVDQAQKLTGQILNDIK